MFWLLTRELLRMRGKSEYECVRSVPWKESVDLFFYRDADEIKRQQDAKQRKADKAARAAQQAQYGAMAAAAAAAEDMTGYDNQMGDDMMDDQVQGGYDDMQQPVDNAQVCFVCNLSHSLSLKLFPECSWNMFREHVPGTQIYDFCDLVFSLDFG